MTKDRIIIHAANPLAANCEEVQPHLKTFWIDPDALDSSSLVLINAHLKTCPACQRKFSDIRDKETPPWRM